MSPIGPRHVAFVNNLTQLLVTRLAGRAIVSVQNPVALDDDTEPEPDLAILRRRGAVPYKESEPATEDVLLLIEVGDTSLAYDRGHQAPPLRRVGHPGVLGGDASAEVVEIHREPAPGGYGETRRVTGGAIVSPQAFPDMTLPLAEIFA